ncbi:MAG: UPF0016 family membrane protein [Gammaproteobacteria bacterium]|nr:MAG: UPF0016 family membrane protein [Gammaproteobacteria bacterium]
MALDVFFATGGSVAVAELGDKTQLLAVLLGARFRRPLIVLAGIVLATVLNHGLAAAAGLWLNAWLGGPWRDPLLAAAFLLTGAWCLVPDRLDETTDRAAAGGAFLVTLVAFFLAELGDKTQLVTLLWAAQSPAVFAVLAGSTLGLAAVNLPAVWFGERVLRRLPAARLRLAAAVLFVAVGAWIGLAGRFGS